MNKTYLTTSLLAAGLALASSALTATSAQAFGISLSPENGSTENTGASALLDFDFADAVGGVLLNRSINNTTDGSKGLGATQATLVGVGFDLLSGMSAEYNANGSSFTKLYQNAALQPYGTFDIGIRSAGSGNFAGGNPQGGLKAGESTVVSFLLKGVQGNATSIESAFLSGFTSGSLNVVGRFQQVNAGGGSDKVLGSVQQPPSTEVPEPATMGALALVGGGILSARRRRTKENA